MRVAIDASILCQRKHAKGGQQRYVRELLRHLGAAPGEGAYIVWVNFAHPANRPLYHELRRFLVDRGLPHRLIRCRVPWQVLDGLRLPVELVTGPIDVAHATTTRHLATRRAARVVTIHDLAFFDHPECFEFRDVEQQKRVVRRLAHDATLVLTVSQYARATIIERLGLPEDRVRAVYHGVSRTFLDEDPVVTLETLARRFGLRRPYALFVSTVQPNKNIVRLLRAFDLLRHSELRDWQLVIAGQPGWQSDPSFAAARSLGLDRHVIFTGYVEDEALHALYRNAELFILPSLVEGFGIPAIEAMACGVPVVAAKTGALPEIVGDAGVLIDPYSAEDIARGMWTVIADAALRAELAARGRDRSKHFRWERTAAETAAAYRDAAALC